MKTARDYRCDLDVSMDEITPLPWSEFCESSDWWIGSAASDGGPALYDPVCGANEMTTQDMLYVVWAANTAPEMVKALESSEERIRTLSAGLREYAQHRPTCPARPRGGGSWAPVPEMGACECGLSALVGGVE